MNISLNNLVKYNKTNSVYFEQINEYNLKVAKIYLNHRMYNQ